MLISPYLTYQRIAGGDYDRCEIMRTRRAADKEYMIKTQDNMNNKAYTKKQGNINSFRASDMHNDPDNIIITEDKMKDTV